MAIKYCQNCRAKYSAQQQEQILYGETPRVECLTCKEPYPLYLTPMAVLLQPIVTNSGEMGLMVIHREATSDLHYIELPSYCFHIDEDTKQALIQEAGIDINPETLRDFGTHIDSSGGYLYVFFISETALYEKDLMLNEEPVCRHIIIGYEHEEFFFPHEAKMVKQFFNELWYNDPD